MQYKSTQLSELVCRHRLWGCLGLAIAALGAERITTTVIRGEHLGAAHDVQRE